MAHSRRGRETSWDAVSSWYAPLVGREGHYYHQHVVLPGALRLLALDPQARVLDLACGQGVIGRHVGRNVAYTGIDIAPSLIREAQRIDRSPAHAYVVGDITQPLALARQDFSHGASILALQNVQRPDAVMENAARHLLSGAVFVIVVNHPCFRIPRQSSWGVDEERDLLYRRVDRYLSRMKIPIVTNPGKGVRSPVTWSFHYSLTALCAFLADAGFTIERLEEWVSNKTSGKGRTARRENRAREEIPLFLAIRARKR